MTLHQHVYGRVAAGYRPAGPGYQLAALSPALDEEKGTIERLNRLSFFTPQRGGDTPVRYSFIRPAPGRVAFGASRLARDESGGVGAFAHHFVGTTSALVESGLTPVALLAALRPRFLDSEAALGAERRLPPLDSATLADPPPDRADTRACAGPGTTDAIAGVRTEPDAVAGTDLRVWTLLDACLATPYGGRPRGPVPLVVLSDLAVWPFLEAVFRQLSPQRAAEMTFSTLFVEASSHAVSFRFVLAPEARDEPAGASPFRVLRHDQDDDSLEPANHRHGPYVDFCRRRPHLVWETRRFIDLSHRQPHDLTGGGPLLDTVLHTSEPAASAFRAACESEATPRALLLRLLLASPARARRYWCHGEAVAYDGALADVVWEEATTRLPALLRIAAAGGHLALRDDALADLAARIRTTPQASDLLHALDPPTGGVSSASHSLPRPAAVDARATHQLRPNLRSFIAQAACETTGEILDLVAAILRPPPTGTPESNTVGARDGQAGATTGDGDAATRHAVVGSLRHELAKRLLRRMASTGRAPSPEERARLSAVAAEPRAAAEARGSDFMAAALALARWSAQPRAGRARRPRRGHGGNQPPAGDDAALRLGAYGLERRQYLALLRAAAPHVTRWTHAPESPATQLRHPAHARDFECWALARRSALPFADQVTLLVDLIALRRPDEPSAEVAAAIAADARRVRLATGVLERFRPDDPAAADPERRVLLRLLQAIADRRLRRRLRRWFAGTPWS